eukprot:jgi/Botrbrau1/9491/Bobra.0252s0106.1
MSVFYPIEGILCFLVSGFQVNSYFSHLRKIIDPVKFGTPAYLVVASDKSEESIGAGEAWYRIG